MSQFVTLEQIREANVALERGEPSRLGNAVWDATVAQYHVRRDDDVFLPVEIDETDGEAKAASMAEAESLRAAGHQVLTNYE